MAPGSGATFSPVAAHGSAHNQALLARARLVQMAQASGLCWRRGSRRFTAESLGTRSANPT